MATPDWNSLSPQQRALGVKRWHQRQQAKQASQLSPEARQALAKQRALGQEVAPGLTKGELLAEVRAGTRQKFGEAEAALGDSVRQNRLQTARTGDWFKQYQDAINQAAQKQAATNQAAVQGVQQLQQGLDASSQQQWAGQNAQMTADAANRGASVDPKLADQAHNASNIRNMLTSSYGAMLINQGASQQADLSNRSATSVQQRNEALAGKQSQAADLQRERRRLKQQKGDFKVTYSDQLKSTASDNALKDALRVAQVGETTANTEQTKVETIGKALQNQYFAKYGKLPSTGSNQSPLDAYRLAFAKKNGYFPPTGPPKPASSSTTGKDQFGNTRKDRERFQNQWARSRSLAHLIRGKNDTVGSLTQLIIAKDSTVPPWMARAAAQQIILKYVGPHLRSRLKTHGVASGYSATAPGATGVSGSTDASGD